MGTYSTYYIARIKKPHRKFRVGDLVVGLRMDGMAERLVCSGWSTKFHVLIQNYSLRYQGVDSWTDQNDCYHERVTGRGHLTIIGQFDRQSDFLDELSDVKNRDQFIQQLSLYGGNVLEV